MKGSRFGPSVSIMNSNAGAFVTYAMAGLNTGYCARWQALSTGDIKSVRLNWNAAATPGTVQVRIETVDTTTGQPTGTLYDANATIDVTPAAGVQTYTFATLPTTGLTVGNYYAVVLLTTVAGTTQTLEAYPPPVGAFTAYPVNALTAADGTTRTNFAVVANAIPMLSLVLEDDTEPDVGFFIWGTRSSTTTIYGVRSAGNLFSIKAPLKIYGYHVGLIITGSPVGDLRCRIIDTNNNTISGTEATADNNMVSSYRTNELRLSTEVVLPPGTYRVVADSSSSASGNHYSLRYLTLFNTSGTVENFNYTSTTTGSSWTDTTNANASISLMLSDVTSPISNSFRGGFING